MSESLFVFTIAGVQPFIAQARRLGDLVAGSRLVSELAGAAARGIEAAGGTLIFPPPVQEAAGDRPASAAPISSGMPNTLVARAPAGSEAALGRAARDALEVQFHHTARRARGHLARFGPPPDRWWEEIWERQGATAWETYWAAASLAGRGYAAAYDEVRRALDACKRTRAFPPSEEPGWKDTLGGTRSALHTGAVRAPEYWKAVAARHSAAELRPDGRERLDALGAVKRFGGLAAGIPSVSDVAAAGFLAGVAGSARLRAYGEALAALLGPRLHRVSDRAPWPHDGDLLYMETLTPRRLRASYGLEEPDPGALRAAREALGALHREGKGEPSPYYGLMRLDGDDMGRHVSECGSAERHAEFSRRVGRFARAVKGSVEGEGGGARLVYAGGDDVLALAPLEGALPLGAALARLFHEITGGTASAGIAVAHHLHPLHLVLAEARAAEREAKGVEGKDAVGVRVLKRSGETVAARARWDRVSGTWELLRGLFGDGSLAGRFAGEAARAAEQLTLAPEALAPEMGRLLARHRRPPGGAEPGADLAGQLAKWDEEMRQSGGELGPWILLARFVGGGGAE